MLEGLMKCSNFFNCCKCGESWLHEDSRGEALPGAAAEALVRPLLERVPGQHLRMACMPS